MSLSCHQPFVTLSYLSKSAHLEVSKVVSRYNARLVNEGSCVRSARGPIFFRLSTRRASFAGRRAAGTGSIEVGDYVCAYFVRGASGRSAADERAVVSGRAGVGRRASGRAVGAAISSFQV